MEMLAGRIMLCQIYVFSPKWIKIQNLSGNMEANTFFMSFCRSYVSVEIGYRHCDNVKQVLN